VLGLNRHRQVPDGASSSSRYRNCASNPQRRLNGCGHDALLAQSLDNRFAVPHMPTTRLRLRASLAVCPDIPRAQKGLGSQTTPVATPASSQGVISGDAINYYRVPFSAEAICPAVLIVAQHAYQDSASWVDDRELGA
jgi:hypothetical protein